MESSRIAPSLILVMKPCCWTFKSTTTQYHSNITICLQCFSFIQFPLVNYSICPSIMFPSIPSPISCQSQCHWMPASLSCRQTKWFHNQYEQRRDPTWFHTLKQTGNSWFRPANYSNQIRNDPCNENEWAYCVIGRTSQLQGLPVDRHHVALQTAKHASFYFGHGEAGPFN